MILLDTNYLIRLLVAGTEEARLVSGWLSQGEELCTSAIAWYEFVTGPVDAEGVDLVRSLLRDRVIPLTADQAGQAARLFQSAGRQRRLRIDAMIAAAAIEVGARLATENRDDFEAFVAEGLRLAAR